MEDSERLKRRAETVSVEVECVRLDIGVLLKIQSSVSQRLNARKIRMSYFVSSHIWTIFDAVANTGSVRW